MKKTWLLLITVLFLCYCSGCESWSPAYKPSTEVSAYSEKTLEAILPLNLHLECEKGAIEVYNWEKPAVKFEVTRKISGTQVREKLEEQLEDFVVDWKHGREGVSFFGRQKRIFGHGGQGKLEVKVFIPKRTVQILCRVQDGTLHFYDDLNCRLEIQADTVHTEINRLDGTLVFHAEKGDLRLSSGSLETGSAASVKQGNLRIRSQWDEPGEYAFETGAGLVELQLPKELHAVFETSGFAMVDDFRQGDLAARFKLVSSLGEIHVRKF